MTENFANTYQTTLAADLTAVATTLTVASATGAPAPQFRLLIDAEIVLVTAVAGVTYTVTRGVEGTTAASHTASAVVSHVVTAGALAQLKAEAAHVIQDEGVARAARGALNFVGPALTVTDDSAGNRTTVTLPTASPTVEGSLAPADKSKLDGVSAGAQVNVLEGVTGTAPIVAGAIAAKVQALSITAASGSAPGSMSAADFSKLAGYPATPGLDGHTIQDEGTALAQRAGLNFVGPALTVTDDSAGNRTTVTLPTASATVEGSLSAADKGKLDGVAAGAQVNVLEGITGTAPIVAGAIAGKSQAVSISAATGSAAGSMSAADFSKLATVAAGARESYSLLVNGGLEVWQRGAGAFTANAAYSADRWQIVLGGTSTLSVSKDTTNVAVGSGACAALTYTHNAVSSLSQKLEDYLQLRGQSVAFSARVRGSVASSARLRVTDGTTTWYSTYHSGGGAYETLSVVAAIGTAATLVTVALDLGATGTYYLDNAMLVTGAQAQDYQPLTPAEDLARCQRYYEIASGGVSMIVSGTATAAGQFSYTTVPWKVAKAVSPTVTKVGTWSVSNCGQPAVANPDAFGVQLYISATAAGSFYSTGSATAYIVAESNP